MLAPTTDTPVRQDGVMPELQRQFTVTLERVLSGVATLATENSPDWLKRPGEAEMGALWPLAQRVYSELTGLELPRVAPLRERRRVDVVLSYASGARRIVEFDERQHFTEARLRTLEFYDHLAPVAFEVGQWRERCEQLRGREAGGGFAAPKPPLFPGPGGRHRQRAFRDFLADALPSVHGWLPTVRFQDVETKKPLSSGDADSAIVELWSTKTSEVMASRDRLDSLADIEARVRLGE